MTDEETRLAGTGLRKFAVITAFAAFVFVTIAILVASAAKDPVLERLRPLGLIDKGPTVVDARPAECYYVHAMIKKAALAIDPAMKNMVGGTFNGIGSYSSHTGEFSAESGRVGDSVDDGLFEWSTVYDYRTPLNPLRKIAAIFRR